MELEELQVYSMVMELGEDVWVIVAKWNYFEKDTIGKQLIRASDSIAVNLSEGFGQYHYKETKNFGYYSRDSLYETKMCLTKANNRNLIQNEQYQDSMQKIKFIGKMLNKYISSIGKQVTNSYN